MGQMKPGSHLVGTDALHSPTLSRVRKDLTMTVSPSPTPHQFVAIPRHPTLDDVRAYMEFLAREHLELHAAIVSAELAYANANRDLNPGSPAPGESAED